MEEDLTLHMSSQIKCSKRHPTNCQLFRGFEKKIKFLYIRVIFFNLHSENKAGNRVTHDTTLSPYFAHIMISVNSVTWHKLNNSHLQIFNYVSLLGCSVGTCWPSRSSFNMCRSVVFPALSRPRKTSFPDFLYRPGRNISQLYQKLRRNLMGENQLNHLINPRGGTQPIQ